MKTRSNLTKVWERFAVREQKAPTPIRHDNKRKSVPMRLANLIRAIRKLPKRWQEIAAQEFFRPITIRKKDGSLLKTRAYRRHGSPLYARQHPKLKVTDEQRRNMAMLYSLGMSFRAIEEIYHLKPTNGNDAYRQVLISCDWTVLNDRARAEARKLAVLVVKQRRISRPNEKPNKKLNNLAKLVVQAA